MEASRDDATGKWSLTGVEPANETFERMCKMLREGENFKFARYGDGEFNCMFGKVGHNCDGHEYFPDLGMALNDAFYSDPKYMVGIQPLSVQGGLYQKAMMQREGGPKNIYDADVLHSASIDGRMYQFFASIAHRNILLVGPDHLSSVLAHCSNFSIPKINCWKDYELIVHNIYHYLIDKTDVVVLLCASMMSEVIIHSFRSEPHTFIDCGSVFDPYVGVNSRRYHHKLAISTRP